MYTGLHPSTQLPVDADGDVDADSDADSVADSVAADANGDAMTHLGAHPRPSCVITPFLVVKANAPCA